MQQYHQLLSLVHHHKAADIWFIIIRHQTCIIMSHYIICLNVSVITITIIIIIIITILREVSS